MATVTRERFPAQQEGIPYLSEGGQETEVMGLVRSCQTGLDHWGSNGDLTVRKTVYLDSARHLA